jgi:Fe-S-cluster-containing hydrogenase component 2
LVKEIVERSAILLALAKVYPAGVKISKLNQLLASWRDHLKFLQTKGIDIEVTASEVKLNVPVYYDLYQSIPPEIRGSVEQLLWRFVTKEPIINKGSLMQRGIKPIEHVINNVLSRTTPSTDRIDENYIKWITRADTSFPLACIQCANAPCMWYGTQAFGQTDAFSYLVCPADVIKQSQDGVITIDQEGCGGCMICIVRCPIEAIFTKDGVATKREYHKLPNHQRYVEEFMVSFDEKEKATFHSLAKLTQINTSFKTRVKVKEILYNFDDKMLATKLNWDQDRYYIWVRNSFRELGLDALYTGAAGKLRRADVTIRRPFYAGVEVKSPAEGEINVGALRQAADARREVWKTYGAKDVYCAVVGREIERGVHARALEWDALYNVKIPLIRGRYLLYLMLKHKTYLPQDPLRDIQRLFTDFAGWFGKKELKQYFEAYFKIREEELRSRTISLPMSLVIIKALKTGNRAEAISMLKQIEKETYEEIERCFPDPERTARGGYSVVK